MICIWSNATSRYKDNTYYNDVMVQAFVNAVVTIVAIYDETEFRVLNDTSVGKLPQSVIHSLSHSPSHSPSHSLTHSFFSTVIDYFKEFNNEVLIKIPINPSMKNGQGLFHSRFNVFSSITGEMYKDFINNQSDKFVAAIGDVGKIKEYMNKLIIFDSMQS